MMNVSGVEKRFRNIVRGFVDGESFWGKHHFSKQAGIDTQQAVRWWPRFRLRDLCWRPCWSFGIGRFSIRPAVSLQNGEIASTLCLTLFAKLLKCLCYVFVFHLACASGIASTITNS